MRIGGEGEGRGNIRSSWPIPPISQLHLHQSLVAETENITPPLLGLMVRGPRFPMLRGYGKPGGKK